MNPLSDAPRGGCIVPSVPILSIETDAQVMCTGRPFLWRPLVYLAGIPLVGWSCPGLVDG